MSHKAIAEVYNQVIAYIRTEHTDEIEKAYEYFWEEEFPEDFLSGTALEVGFLNFEDWLVCDYSPKDNKTFIERFIEDTSPDEDTTKKLKHMQKSYISIHEVTSNSDGNVKLKNLAINEDIELTDESMTNLSAGDVFGARFIKIDDAYFMGRCVYPFGNGSGEAVMRLINKLYDRYAKNSNPGADMINFLKSEAYSINTAWVSTIDAPLK